MTPMSKTALLAALAALLLLAPGCNKERTPAANNAATAEGIAPNEVVGTYDDQKITGDQLNKKLGDQLAKLKNQYEEQRYNTIRQGVQQMALEDILHKQAQAKGMTEEEYLKQQIEANAQPPTDQEVQDFYEKNKEQMGGQPLEQMKEQIRAYLMRQQSQKQAAAFFQKMEKDHNIKVTVAKPVKPKKNVEAKGPARGAENAPVTIIEFSDFQCPYCGRAYETIEEVMKNYGGKVRLVYRQFPLNIHQNAQKAAEASLCAGDQNKFWEMYSTLFQHQGSLEVEHLKEYAKQLGLDADKFNKCVDSGEKASAVSADMAAGEAAGVNATPTFYVNGTELSGALPYEDFASTIDDELASKK
jgi:protein-disulfide isomerase